MMDGGMGRGRGGLTSEESPNAKTRCEACFFRRGFIGEAEIDVQRVGEDDGFRFRDALAIIKLTHQGDEFKWVAGVLADAREGLGVGFWFAGGVVEVGGQGGVGGGFDVDDAVCGFDGWTGGLRDLCG